LISAIRDLAATSVAPTSDRARPAQIRPHGAAGRLARTIKHRTKLSRYSDAPERHNTIKCCVFDRRLDGGLRPRRLFSAKRVQAPCAPVFHIACTRKWRNRTPALDRDDRTWDVWHTYRRLQCSSSRRRDVALRDHAPGGSVEHFNEESGRLDGRWLRPIRPASGSIGARTRWEPRLDQHDRQVSRRPHVSLTIEARCGDAGAGR